MTTDEMLSRMETHTQNLAERFLHGWVCPEIQRHEVLFCGFVKPAIRIGLCTYLIPDPSSSGRPRWWVRESEAMGCRDHEHYDEREAASHALAIWFQRVCNRTPQTKPPAGG